jgi:aldose 1-epimerase
LKAETRESHSVRPFGVIAGRKPVDAHLLEGAPGISAQIITYGATVTHLRVPDRDGKLSDVVLGFNQLDDYLKPQPYFGAMAGRVGGRITGGQFALDGRRYSLARNDGPNHLHGGIVGFDKHIWSATRGKASNGAVSVRLSRVSPDGEEGYPGNVNASVTYTVTADNQFIVDVVATSDAPTPFSLTHHSYFNLAGEGSGSTEDHELQIFADTFVPVTDSFALTGRHEVVNANDLRRSRRLGDVIPKLYGQHGDLYFVNRPKEKSSLECVPAARLTDPASGRVLTVSTTEDYIQLYTGAKLDSSLMGKSGRRYGPFGGLCLECEGYPDGANNPAFGDIILRPGRTVRQTTIYAFSVA